MPRGADTCLSARSRHSTGTALCSFSPNVLAQHPKPPVRQVRSRVCVMLMSTIGKGTYRPYPSGGGAVMRAVAPALRHHHQSLIYLSLRCNFFSSYKTFYPHHQTSSLLASPTRTQPSLRPGTQIIQNGQRLIGVANPRGKPTASLWKKIEHASCIQNGRFVGIAGKFGISHQQICLFEHLYVLSLSYQGLINPQIHCIYAYFTLHSLVISTHTEADTSQCSLTEQKPDCSASEETGFLRLPPELRYEVYRALLGPKATCKFQINILRVSKRIHDEAVKIFYRENGFIMYHIHHKVLDQLKPTPQGDRNDWPSALDLYPVTGADGKIGSEPALTVSIALQHSCSSVPDSQWQDEWNRYVGFPTSIPPLCRFLTVCQIRNRLHLRLSLPSMVEYRTSEGLLGTTLLDCFQECRGVGAAEIFVAGGLPGEIDLSSLMTKPLEHFDELLTRARCYQDRVRQQLTGHHFLETLPTLARADSFFSSWIDHGVELSNETDEKWIEFWDLRLHISMLHAFEWLQHGKPKEARQVINHTSKTYPLKLGSLPVPRRLLEKESEGYYILGLCSLFDGCKICALYDFLQALISKPGHEGVDKEIDNMEAAIKNSSHPPDEIVRWNIKHVLGKFRHQPSLDADDHSHRGPASMTEDELSALKGNFVHFISDRPRSWY